MLKNSIALPKLHPNARQVLKATQSNTHVLPKHCSILCHPNSILVGWQVWGGNGNGNGNGNDKTRLWLSTRETKNNCQSCQLLGYMEMGLLLMYQKNVNDADVEADVESMGFTTCNLKVWNITGVKLFCTRQISWTLVVQENICNPHQHLHPTPIPPSHSNPTPIPCTHHTRRGVLIW